MNWLKKVLDFFCNFGHDSLDMPQESVFDKACREHCEMQEKARFAPDLKEDKPEQD